MSHGDELAVAQAAALLAAGRPAAIVARVDAEGRLFAVSCRTVAGARASAPERFLVTCRGCNATTGHTYPLSYSVGDVMADTGYSPIFIADSIAFVCPSCWARLGEAIRGIVAVLGEAATMDLHLSSVAKHAPRPRRPTPPAQVVSTGRDDQEDR